MWYYPVSCPAHIEAAKQWAKRETKRAQDWADRKADAVKQKVDAAEDWAEGKIDSIKDRVDAVDDWIDDKADDVEDWIEDQFTGPIEDAFDAFKDRVLRYQSKLANLSYDKLFSTVTSCPVNIHKDEIGHISVHLAQFVTEPPAPLPCYESSKQYIIQGYAAGQNKLTSTVKHQVKGTNKPQGAIVLKGHEIGPGRTHKEVPNKLKGQADPTSSCKVMFAAASVRMDDKSVACVDRPFFIMVACGVPLKGVLMITTTNQTNTVNVGMSNSDIMIGFARTLLEVGPSVVKMLINEYKKFLYKKYLDKWKGWIDDAREAITWLDKGRRWLKVGRRKAALKAAQKALKILKDRHRKASPLGKRLLEPTIKAQRKLVDGLKRAVKDAQKEKKHWYLRFMDRNLKKSKQRIKTFKKVVDWVEKKIVGPLIDQQAEAGKKGLDATQEGLDNWRRSGNKQQLGQSSTGPAPLPVY